MNVKNNEDDILARAIRELGLAVTGQTVFWEEALIVDVPLSAAAGHVHAVLDATKHPLLPGQPATSGDQHEIRWIAGRSGVGGEQSPVLISVSLTSQGHHRYALTWPLPRWRRRIASRGYLAVSKERTLIKIRGAAREEGSIKPWSAARAAVDWLMGMLGERFDPYDIVDIIG